MTHLHPLTFLCRICNLISFRLIVHFQKICKFCVLYKNDVVSTNENPTYFCSGFCTLIVQTLLCEVEATETLLTFILYFAFIY